jgi:hypothetical protein
MMAIFPSNGFITLWIFQVPHLKHKGTVSPDFEGFFMTYDIKSVLSAWALVVILIF